MAKLKEAGLITCTPDGVCQNYRLDDENFALVKEYFLDFYEQIEDWKKRRKECKLVIKNEPEGCSR
jgi:hypothetical protein